MAGVTRWPSCGTSIHREQVWMRRAELQRQCGHDCPLLAVVWTLCPGDSAQKRDSAASLPLSSSSNGQDYLSPSQTALKGLKNGHCGLSLPLQGTGRGNSPSIDAPGEPGPRSSGRPVELGPGCSHLHPVCTHERRPGCKPGGLAQCIL